MIQVRPLLFGIAVLACSSSGSLPSGPTSGGELRLANATGVPFAFFAVAADMAPLLDPVPEISVTDPSTRLVPAGAERAVGEVSGREGAPGGGVAVFLYRVTPDGMRARFTRVQLASGEEIRNAGNRIVIARLGP
ncbi:MAG TPA: hypothetical protein VIG08_17595 [Gemmatimonadales bacterium]|jgi:hypothetical protein